MPSPHSRRTVLRAASAGAATVAALGHEALLPAGTAAARTVPAQRPSSAASTDLQAAFEEAAARHGVPVSVLLAVSYAQSRWDGHHGAASVAGGYGPMHLTDAAHALCARRLGPRPAGDRRGDPARPLRRAPRAVPHPAEERLLPAGARTLSRAAALTGLPAEELRASSAANVHGGAALLAQAQRELGRPLSEDPAAWRDAVAAFAYTGSGRAAEVFADDVFAVLATGAERVTDEGQRLVLDPVAVAAEQRPGGERDPHVEAPPSVSCEWLPAPYVSLGDGDYGNHDKADRPHSQQINYIVIHDTEADWDTTLDLVRDPEYVSWHYSLRSADGHIAQHLATKDVGWHAGNWYVNATSIGLEHEGFVTDPDAWYTEAMYRASARLVRYLARRYDIPLDRDHIIGHDNVPGTVTESIPGMHTDPGPYWDWAHYFTLLGAPFPRAAAGPRDDARSGVVTIAPDYDTNRPSFDDCGEAGGACAPHGSSAVRLHAAPAHDAPLVRDVGTHPDGDGESSTGVNDVGARATAGQRYAYAGRQGDWTAIWYLGQRAWFHDPDDAPVSVRGHGLVATGRPGAAVIPVYGRAYPEAAAYPEDVPVQEVSPLVYEIPADQEYPVGLVTASEYFYAVTFDPSHHRVVRGEEYLQIQLGHRVAYVRRADVRVRRV
ncbi:N-acetylmuramoyl-L-alanine amidase [Streptomyces sp. 7-21]|uniref:N-acetylmuramoyl-L-alanine amidase n=1 Tax=Streptomyces sp. 7-21 TaxID=2802283 RepID=UPI0027DCFBD3|nr:N-acetylmuramoyl-L-alanine amidase [Streptomyces sp. 7-21]